MAAETPCQQLCILVCFLSFSVLAEWIPTQGATTLDFSTSDPRTSTLPPLVLDPSPPPGSVMALSYDGSSFMSGASPRDAKGGALSEFQTSYSDADNAISDGFCKTWIGTLVAENTTWEEQHCRKCRCDATLGAVCQDPQCAIAFHPYLETNCEQWSSDGCCCIRSACVHEGKHYAADDWFVLTYDDPCTLCQCNPSDGLPRCVLTKCPPLLCVDAAHVPGLCCPVCTSGLNCDIPPLPLPEGQFDLTPVPASMSRVLNSTLESPSRWNCTCNNPGEMADCLQVEDSRKEKPMDKGENLPSA